MTNQEIAQMASDYTDAWFYFREAYTREQEQWAEREMARLTEELSKVGVDAKSLRE